MASPRRRHLNLRLLLLLIAACAAAPVDAHAGAGAQARPRTTTIVYDVRDLVVERPVIVPPPGTGLIITREVRAKLAESPPPTRDELTEQVIAIIRKHVDPDHWRERGGAVGTVQHLNGNLIITTTAANHDEIARLLSQLRESAAPVSVVVEMDVMRIDVSTLDRLGLELERHGHTTLGGWRSAILSRDEADRVRTSLQVEPAVCRVAAPSLIMLDRQAATIVVGSEREVRLPELPRTVERDRLVAVRPLDGFAAWVEPAVSADRTSIDLRLNPRLARLDVRADGVEEIAAQALTTLTVADGGSAVLVMPFVRFRLACALTGVDDDGATFVRAIVRDPIKAKPAHDGHVLVLVRPRIVIAPDDPQE